jgi:hypothetical protein
VKNHHVLYYVGFEIIFNLINCQVNSKLEKISISGFLLFNIFVLTFQKENKESRKKVNAMKEARTIPTLVYKLEAFEKDLIK